MNKRRFNREPPKKILLNKYIPFVRFTVIDETGKNLGVLTRDEALTLAESKELDLFCVKNDSEDPLCKILDYGKYQYEKQKMTRKTKKIRPGSDLKEIRLSAGIGDRDLEIKLQNARKFLKENKKVKVSMRLRGRERYIKGYGFDKLNSIIMELSEEAEILQTPKLVNRIYNMILIPLKKNKKHEKPENQKPQNENKEITSEKSESDGDGKVDS